MILYENKDEKTLGKSILNFSKKFSKLSKEQAENLKVLNTKSDYLQGQINKLEEERISAIRKNYADFLEPRTPDIEEDESDLLKVYELFCAVSEANTKKGDSRTHLRAQNLQFSSPLCRRADYTHQDRFSYLRLWFLQTVPVTQYIPQIVCDKDGSFYLEFIERELWVPNSLEKEILQLL
ncbi:MAG: hypothetical protein J6X84_08930 [Treponema sp.]|nr:hypothetical protein [Treponema sp.]